MASTRAAQGRQLRGLAAPTRHRSHPKRQVRLNRRSKALPNIPPPTGSARSILRVAPAGKPWLFSLPNTTSERFSHTGHLKKPLGKSNVSFCYPYGSRGMVHPVDGKDRKIPELERSNETLLERFDRWSSRPSVTARVIVPSCSAIPCGMENPHFDILITNGIIRLRLYGILEVVRQAPRAL